MFRPSGCRRDGVPIDAPVAVHPHPYDEFILLRSPPDPVLAAVATHHRGVHHGIQPGESDGRAHGESHRRRRGHFHPFSGGWSAGQRRDRRPFIADSTLLGPASSQLHLGIFDFESQARGGGREGLLGVREHGLGSVGAEVQVLPDGVVLRIRRKVHALHRRLLDLRLRPFKPVSRTRGSLGGEGGEPPRSLGRHALVQVGRKIYTAEFCLTQSGSGVVLSRLHSCPRPTAADIVGLSDVGGPGADR